MSEEIRWPRVFPDAVRANVQRVLDHHNDEPPAPINWLCEYCLMMADEIDRLRVPLAATAIPAAEPAASPPPASEWCIGFGREGSTFRCCDRAGEYNGFGSDGPTSFTCPKGCPCHD